MTSAPNLSEQDELPFPRNIQACPYPFYEHVRDHAPVYGIPGRDDSFVSRWHDIATVTDSPDVFSSALPSDGRPLVLPEGYDFDYSPLSMAGSDPPEHRQKRLSGLKLIGRERLREYTPLIERVADELIDSFAARGEVEFVSGFADWLPIRVIVDVLGLPAEDAADLKRWTDSPGQGARYLTDEELAAERERSADLRPYLERAIRDRVESPRDDGLGILVRDQIARDGRPNVPYLMAEAGVLAFAGNATTTHMLGSTMVLLLQNPDVLAQVQSDLELVKPLIEESLRLESPVQFTQRACRDDVELAGEALPAGTVVLCGWASGNRDPRKWGDDADSLRLDRPDVAKHHLAFGRGPHLCLGAPLARLEGEIAFRKLLSRLRNIRFAPGGEVIEPIDHPHLRAPKRVQLEFDPER
jgi:cytochrome P450